MSQIAEILLNCLSLPRNMYTHLTPLRISLFYLIRIRIGFGLDLHTSSGEFRGILRLISANILYIQEFSNYSINKINRKPSISSFR